MLGNRRGGVNLTDQTASPQVFAKLAPGHLQRLADMAGLVAGANGRGNLLS